MLRVMARRPPLAPRKTPVQRRARQMNEDILTGAIRVLAKHGPLKFTTTRVAEAAGISVGSLYRYYPNKESLLFALHEREIRVTRDAVRRILNDDTTLLQGTGARQVV
jgi:AcrR family transcriptional regulator